MFFLQNGFISISCITVNFFMNFGGDLEVILVNNKREVKTTSLYSYELTDGVDSRVKK